MKQFIVVLSIASLMAFSCTRKQGDVDAPQVGNPQPINNNTPIGGGDGAEQNEGTVATVLDEQTLKTNYAIDTSNLTYKFSYLNISQDGDIDFVDGKAQLVFRRLPVGRAGDLTLDLYEGSTLKLRGAKLNTTLTSGQNQLQLTMQEVDPDGSGNGNNGGGNTTDLIIDVILGDGGSTNPPPSGGGGGTPTPTPPPPPPSDELPANWDGKSHLGNSSWQIVPVEG